MFCFLVFTAKKSGRNFLADLSKLYVYCPQWHSEEHQFPVDLFFFFLVLECCFYPSCKTDTARLSKIHFACPKDFVGNKGVFWIIRSIFSRSCTLSETFRAFLWKKAGKVVKTDFYLSRRSFFLSNLWKTIKCLLFFYLR